VSSRSPASGARRSRNSALVWPETDEVEEVSEIVDISLSPAHQAERSETLRALDSEHWNISRAARILGMTRHGLKKRMRRLQVARPN
jgi:transcriptional regulator with GAF, ATPase, and Fis domain